MRATGRACVEGLDRYIDLIVYQLVYLIELQVPPSSSLSIHMRKWLLVSRTSWQGVRTNKKEELKENQASVFFKNVFALRIIIFLRSRMLHQRLWRGKLASKREQAMQLLLVRTSSFRIELQ